MRILGSRGERVMDLARWDLGLLKDQMMWSVWVGVEMVLVVVVQQLLLLLLPDVFSWLLWSPSFYSSNYLFGSNVEASLKWQGGSHRLLDRARWGDFELALLRRPMTKLGFEPARENSRYKSAFSFVPSTATTFF